MANLEFYWIHSMLFEKSCLLSTECPFYVSVDAWALASAMLLKCMYGKLYRSIY
jgi:hypothetical protein